MPGKQTDPRDTAAWEALEAIAQGAATLRLPELLGEPDRYERCSLQLGDLVFDFSRQRVNEAVMGQLLALAEPHFARNTWKAFCRVALDGAKPDVVAEEMGMSRNAVIIAKCRVLSRLRQESEGLIECSSGFFAKS